MPQLKFRYPRASLIAAEITLSYGIRKPSPLPSLQFQVNELAVLSFDRKKKSCVWEFSIFAVSIDGLLTCMCEYECG